MLDVKIDVSKILKDILDDTESCPEKILWENKKSFFLLMIMNFKIKKETH